jgi:hypothetical protein
MGQLVDLQRASLERLRARLAFCLTRGSGAPPLLLHAARRLVPSTPDWRVRPTSMRSAQRSSPGGSIAAMLHNGLGRYDSAFAVA